MTLPAEAFVSSRSWRTASRAPRRRRRRAAGSSGNASIISSRTSWRTAGTSTSGTSSSSSSWICRTSFAGPSLVAQAPVHADHRELDDVGGRALDHGVDREPLAERAHLPVRRAQLRDRPATAEHRHRVAALAGLVDRPRDPLRDPRHAPAVGVDVRLRLLAGDVELVGQAEARDAVDDAEVDGLRAVPLVLASARPGPCRAPPPP